MMVIIDWSKLPLSGTRNPDFIPLFGIGKMEKRFGYFNNKGQLVVNPAWLQIFSGHRHIFLANDGFSP